MRIRSLAVGLTRRNDFTDRETEVDRGSWDGEDLPSRAGFVSAVEWLYRSIELPDFPGSAWVEIDVGDEVRRCEIPGAVGEPARIAGVLWAYLVTETQGLG